MLAVDLGTGGPKTALVTTTGEVLAHELTSVETTRLPGGGAIQDPDQWWAAVTGSARRLLDAGVVAPERVVGVACTGQWGSTVPVGSDGQAVGPCLLWMDGRGHRYSRVVLRGPGPIRIEGYDPTRAVRFIRKTGGAPAPGGNDPLGHVLYLRNEDPETYRLASVFLEPVDYLTLRFTGRAAATPASMILSWLVDIRDLDNPRYAPDLVRLTTRERSKLPELVPTGSVVGTVCAQVAGEIGLPRDVPVVAGIPDLLSALTGSGSLGDFEAHMAVSTSSWLSCHVPFKKTDPFRHVATVPGVLPGRYAVANNHDTAGVCLEWFRDSQWGPLIPGDAGPPGDSPARPSYRDLDGIVERTACGSGGVIFAPWLSGERCPVDDPTLRGSFLNLSLRTTRAQMLRAVYEGVAMNGRWMQDAVEHFIKRPVGPIRFIGGGASSEEWCQIHADVLERPVHQVDQPLLANVRGVGLYGAMALGRIDAGAAAAAVRVSRVFTPRPEHRAVYDELYRPFAGLYRQQHRMYAGLNRAAGPFGGTEGP